MSHQSSSSGNRTIRGYRLVKMLGTGATSAVYLAEKNGQYVALKVFKDAKLDLKCIANELNSVMLVPG